MYEVFDWVVEYDFNNLVAVPAANVQASLSALRRVDMWRETIGAILKPESTTKLK
jgi:hypothetical protein